MVGILTEVTPNGCLHMVPVNFDISEECKGEFETIGSIYEGDQLLKQFKREMCRKYDGLLPNFRPDSKLAIKKVIFNNPATIVIWSDNSKTVVKCQPGDVYSEELGLAMCISKKFLGNKGNFNEEFKKWIPDESISVEEMRDKLDKYCIDRHNCCNCLLYGRDVCRCGYGTSFDTRNKDGSYDMSDDEIRYAYNKVFTV